MFRRPEPYDRLTSCRPPEKDTGDTRLLYDTLEAPEGRSVRAEAHTLDRDASRPLKPVLQLPREMFLRPA